ncbi:hypothetical protein EDB80DRAFT_825864 [Ilyonectria destructans]|nr:hypothetical protein EDB80DRAFT_825864 [Ilyonectria destructans]
MSSSAGHHFTCTRCPTKKSLYYLFYEYVGISLFVRPIRWTDLHTELLSTQWEELPPCDSPIPAIGPNPTPSEGHLRLSDTITTLSDCLTAILESDATDSTCSDAVKEVLVTLWPQPFSTPYLPELHLYFGGRVYREAVRVQIMWNFLPEETESSYSSFRSVSTQPADSFNAPTQPSASMHDPHQLPMMCYIDIRQLAKMRKKAFGTPKTTRKGPNEPVERLVQLLTKPLVPSNLNHDAYFVAIFLAMAQKHFYPSPPPSTRRESPMNPQRDIPPSPKFQDLTLYILTHDTDMQDFIVYTGYVTKEFLERFHNPFKGPLGEKVIERSGIRIEYARVPIWPILGLRERLGKALGYSVVGNFDVDKMETWVTELKSQEDGKRKRPVVSDDGTSSGTKKRCV